MAGHYNDNWEWVDDEYQDPYVPPSPSPTQVGSFYVPINSNQPVGTQDLSYWQSRHDEGLPGAPGVNDMFDTDTGQLRPGWVRTANGYERTGIAPAAGPAPAAYDPYPTTYGGGFNSNFLNAPHRSLASLNYPSLNLPRLQAPPAFAYESFTAPSREEAETEPGFDYALKQGVKAYENSKAYTGTYRGGSTIKGINDYARNMAAQNYGQVFDRKTQTYDRNRNNAAENYMTNYGVTRDVFDRDFAATQAEFAPKARAAELEYARDWDLFAYEGDDAYRKYKALLDANS